MSEFVVCNLCVKEYHVPSWRHHPLVRAGHNVAYAHFSGNWRCHGCGLVFFNPLIYNSSPWHRLQCEYDLCNNCMLMLNFDLSRLSSTAVTNSHLVPLNHQLNVPEEPIPMEITEGDGDECIICQEKPKNATLIHGDTGHVCCCWSCAQVLKSRGDACPICGENIDHVIEQLKA